MKKNKGFTLIELLVVIAIIGILAAIVLVSLSGARNSAKDARIQADMSQLRVAGTTYNLDKGSYDGLDAETSVATLLADIASQGPASAFIATNATDYCAAVILNNGTNYWCVDSSLNSYSEAADPTQCVSGGAGHTPLCK